MRWSYDAVWRRRQGRTYHFIFVWRMSVPVCAHNYLCDIIFSSVPFNLIWTICAIQCVQRDAFSGQLHHFISADQLPNKYISMVLRMRTPLNQCSLFARNSMWQRLGDNFSMGSKSWLPFRRNKSLGMAMAWCTIMRDAGTRFRTAVMRNRCTALAAWYVTGSSRAPIHFRCSSWGVSNERNWHIKCEHDTYYCTFLECLSLDYSK